MTVMSEAIRPAQFRARRLAASFITLFLFAGACALLFASTASANDVYISQNGNGGGSSCSDTQSATYFNTPGNWGSGGNQIGPGTTVHVCGTFTGTAGGTMLSFQ